MSSLQHKSLAIIGAGNIGRILLERLMDAGVPAGQIVICDSDPSRAGETSRRFGPRACLLTEEPLPHSDIFLLAAPPNATLDILRTLAPNLREGQVVVSFAAAVSISRLEAVVPPGVAVARVMPNAPSKVGKGMNPVAYGSHITPEMRTLIDAALQTFGESIEVRDEQMNWCVGLSGAAMSSLLPVLEGMTQAGMEAGLDQSEARYIAAQVMLGTASLVLQTGLTFEQIKALTPMQTVDETEVTQIFLSAARQAKEKMDAFQRKLEISEEH